MYIEQQEGHGAGRKEVVDDAGVGAAVVGWNHPTVFRFQDRGQHLVAVEAGALEQVGKIVVAIVLPAHFFGRFHEEGIDRLIPVVPDGIADLRHQHFVISDHLLQFLRSPVILRDRLEHLEEGVKQVEDIFCIDGNPLTFRCNLFADRLV